MQLEKDNKRLQLLAFVSGSILTLVYIYLFMWKSVGVSHMVFSVLMVIVSALPVVLGWVKPKKDFAKKFVLYSVALIGLSTVFLYRTDVITLFWAFTLAPVVYSLLVLSAYHPGVMKNWGVVYFLKVPFIVIGEYFYRGFKYIGNFKFSLFASPRVRSIIRRVTLGTLLAMPFLFVFMGLFASSNPEFAEALKDFFTMILELWFEDFEEFVLFLFKIFMGFWVGLHIVSWNYYTWLEDSTLAEKFKGIKDVNEDGDKKNWDSLVVSVFLFLLNLLFLSYVSIESGYFFAGEINVIGDDSTFTYAEYARRGFAELVVASFLVYVILLAVNLKTSLVSTMNKVMYRINSNLLGVLTLVIAASAVYRIHILQSVYGFTAVRFTGMFWTVLIAVLIVGVIVAAWLPRYVKQVSRMSAVIGLLGLVFYFVFPIDMYLARGNYNRFLKTNEIDLPYMLNLSDEALPVLVELADDDTLSDVGRSTVIEELSLRYDSYIEGREEYGWQAFSMWKDHYYSKAYDVLNGYDGMDARDSLVEFIDDYAEALGKGDYDSVFDNYWAQGIDKGEWSDLEDLEVISLDIYDPGKFVSWDAVNYDRDQIGYKYEYWDGMPIDGVLKYWDNVSRSTRCVDEVVYVRLENDGWKLTSANAFYLSDERGGDYDYGYYYDDDYSTIKDDWYPCD